MMRLLLARLRRDRVQLPIWILGTALLAITSGTAVSQEFADAAERESLVRVAVASPAIVALRGLPNGADLGALVFFQVFTYLAIIAGLMNVFLVARHTRADEERGRFELVAATPVHRTAPLAATLLHGLVANLVLALAVALAFVLVGFDAAGAWLAGAATGGVGLAFLGIGAVLAQLMATARGVTGTGSALVGVAFLLRAAGDALGEPSADGLALTAAWPSWLSPIGWGQHTFAFSSDDPAPLALLGVLALLTASVALGVQRGRDLGASIVPERAGRLTGRVRSAGGLVWRLHRGTVLGWAIGGVVLGLFAGSLAGVVADVVAGNAAIERVLQSINPGGRGEIVQVFAAALLSFAGLLAAAAACQAVMRARGEEADGRTEAVLAAPIGRAGWVGRFVAVAAVSAAAVALASGLAAGVSLLMAGDADLFWPCVLAGVAQLPAAFVFIGVVALVFVLLPRLTVPVGWAALTVGLVLGPMGGLLDLPDAARDVSPFTHTPALPGDDPDWSGAAVMLGIALVLAAAALAVARRRQLTS